MAIAACARRPRTVRRTKAKVALRVAVAWGYVAQEEIDEIFAILDRVGAMTWSRLQTR